MTRKIRRRRFLQSMGVVAIPSIAGCIDNGEGNYPSGTDVPSSGKVSDLPQPTMGDEDAPVTIEVFKDYACPHCRTYANQVKPKIEKNHVDTGEVKYIYYDFPIPVSRNWSWTVAMMGRAVQHLGGDTEFWQFHDKVYSLDSFSQASLKSVVEETGVDSQEVLSRTQDEVYRPVVQSDRSEGNNRDVPGTPAVFIDGELVKRPSYRNISQLISMSK